MEVHRLSFCLRRCLYFDIVGRDFGMEKEKMKIIVGLGNPGREYVHTRHNVGFEAIDVIASLMNVDVTEKKFKAFMAKGMYGGGKVILLKPQTYMNLSGESVRQAMDYYKVGIEDVVVIFDDVSLALGNIRIRKKGSAGGHNGIKSIIAQTGSQDFPRIKIGVGEKPKGWDLADYVLGRVGEDEAIFLNGALKEAAEAAKMMMEGEVEAAMNRYNKKKEL